MDATEAASRVIDREVIFLQIVRVKGEEQGRMAVVILGNPVATDIRRDIAIGSREMTLEGLIREILRPLLREWLDENLPYLIERLVKKEIDHMVNRAERLDL